MKILALDSAFSYCSVAVWVDGAAVAAERAHLPRGQAEALMPMVARVRDAAGIALTDMDRFAVTIGPGHFTGLRTGLAAARGLALAAGRPLIGVETLTAIAAAVPAAERADATVLVALDSKRAEAYVQAFDAALHPLAPPAAHRLADYAAMITVSGQRRFLLAGDASDLLAAALSPLGVAMARATSSPYPDAAIVASLAASAPLPDAPPNPLYIHPVEITTAAKRRA